MQGRRIFPDSRGNLTMSEGDYGQDGRGVWNVRPPGCHAGGIPQHEVIEHEDGTITVSPSIVFEPSTGQPAYHGFLERGVWRVA